MQQKPASALQRTQDINERLYARNIASEPLQPYLEARAVSTKYAVLPVIDFRRPVSVPLHQDPIFNTKTAFNPGTGQGPWSGFATNVNDESVLRNQIYANQKCGAAEYIPSSKSDLYKVHWTNSQNANDSSRKQHADHPYLFEEAQFAPHNPNPAFDKIGAALFHNSTRHQLNE
jgi:hypothetical protein